MNKISESVVTKLVMTGIETAALKRAKPADVVVIVGANEDLALVEDMRRTCEAGALDAEFVGTGRTNVSAEEILSLRQSGRLGGGTHVFLLAHGLVKPGMTPQQAGQHTIELVADAPMSTVGAITLLREPSEGVPAWTGPLHVHSCFEGYLTDEIKPGSPLWNAGPTVLYGGRSAALMGLPDEDLPASLGLISQFKKQGAPVSGLQSFAYLANYTGECVTYMGPDVQEAVTVHAPKSADHLHPDALDAEWRKLETQEKLDIRTRIAGNKGDIEKLVKTSGTVKDGARPKQRSTKMFHIQADRGKPGNFKQLVADYRRKLEAKDRTGRTPLYRACLSGNVDNVKTLLENGADVNAVCAGVTVLAAADPNKKENLGLVRLLCSYGANPDQRIPALGGWTLRHYAETNNLADLTRAMDDGQREFVSRSAVGQPAATQARL